MRVAPDAVRVATLDEGVSSTDMKMSVVFALLSCAFAQSGGKIQGTVTDDSGKPVLGAYAVATFQSQADHSTYSAVTDAKGAYSFGSLPAGKYSICIHTPGGPHLNNCQWATESQATVAGGQTVSAPTIAVTEGALLQIRLDDPKKSISPSDDILVGISLPNTFQPMRLASSDATGRTYDAAVPKKTPVKVTVISTHVQMTDDKGNGMGPQASVQAGASPTSAATLTVLTLQSPSAVNGPPITLTVTGRK
jgi:hypothetical protein